MGVTISLLINLMHHYRIKVYTLLKRVNLTDPKRMNGNTYSLFITVYSRIFSKVFLSSPFLSFSRLNISSERAVLNMYSSAFAINPKELRLLRRSGVPLPRANILKSPSSCSGVQRCIVILSRRGRMFSKI